MLRTLVCWPELRKMVAKTELEQRTPTGWQLRQVARAEAVVPSPAAMHGMRPWTFSHSHNFDSIFAALQLTA